MPAPSQDQEFQRRMSWYFFVLNVKIRKQIHVWGGEISSYIHVTRDKPSELIPMI
jgi:hypothetical protein